MSVVHDPALYRKLSEPKENLDEVNTVSNSFYQDLCALREKHGIPDFVISFAINYKDEEGKEKTAIQVSNRGDSLRSDRLILELVKITPLGSALRTLVEEIATISSKFGGV